MNIAWAFNPVSFTASLRTDVARNATSCRGMGRVDRSQMDLRQSRVGAIILEGAVVKCRVYFIVDFFRGLSGREELRVLPLK